MKHLQADLSTYKHRTTPDKFSSTKLPTYSSAPPFVRAMKLKSIPLNYYSVNLYTCSYKLEQFPVNSLPILTTPTTVLSNTVTNSFDIYFAHIFQNYYFSSELDAQLFMFLNIKPHRLHFSLDKLQEVYPEYFI